MTQNRAQVLVQELLSPEPRPRSQSQAGSAKDLESLPRIRIQMYTVWASTCVLFASSGLVKHRPQSVQKAGERLQSGSLETIEQKWMTALQCLTFWAIQEQVLS